VQRWRLTLRRRRDAPVVAQREWQASIEAALVASELPLAFVDGSAPAARPRIAVAAPLLQGMAAERELLDIQLVRRLPVWQVREAVAATLPEGHELVDVEDVWLGEPAIAGRVVGSDYEVALDAGSVAAIRRAVDELRAASTLPRQRVRGDRTIEYDLRPFIESLEVAQAEAGSVLRMRLRHDPEKGVGRPDEVLAAAGERSGVTLDPGSLVRTGLVLGPLRASSSAADRPPERARPGAGPPRTSAGRPPRRPR
jgi:radical SAM-linked protein